MKFQTILKMFAAAALVSLAWFAGCSSPTGPDGPSTPNAVRDTIPPAPVVDIEASSMTASRVKLRWTAPSDEGGTGSVREYALRYSESEITEENWDQAELAKRLDFQFNNVKSNNIPASRAGEPDSVRVVYLKSETEYWFAVVAIDYDGNTSQVSPNCTVTLPAHPHLKFCDTLELGTLSNLMPSVIDHSPYRIVLHAQHGYVVWDLGSAVNPHFEEGAPISITGTPPYFYAWPGSAYSDGRFFYGIGSFFCVGIGCGEARPEFVRIFDLEGAPVFAGNLAADDVFNRGYEDIPLCRMGDNLFAGADTLGIYEFFGHESLAINGFETGPDHLIRGMVALEPHLLVWNASTDIPLYVINVSDKDNVYVMGSYDPATDYESVQVVDGIAYILTASARLQIVDLADPEQPTLRSTYSIGGSVLSFAVADRTVYVASRHDGLKYYNVEDPSAPTLSGYCHLPVRPEYVAATNEFVFVLESASQDKRLFMLSRPGNL